MTARRLVRVTEQFFEGTTVPTPERPSVRALIAAGLLVPYLAVYAELADDGTVEVFYLDIG